MNFPSKQPTEKCTTRSDRDRTYRDLGGRKQHVLSQMWSTSYLESIESGRDELYCVAGNMILLSVIQQEFAQRYGPHTQPQSSDPPFHPQFHGGLHWFYPDNGKPLNAQLECSTCGKHLSDLVIPLIELHPHN